MTMAQDANSNGDRVVAENYYQYAEHYQRLINQVGDKKNTQERKVKVKEAILKQIREDNKAESAK